MNTYRMKKSFKNKKTYKRYPKSTVPRTIKSIVKKEIAKETETKFIILDLLSYFSSQGTTWGEVDLLNFFGQGPEPNERIGNEIELIGLGIKGNLVGGAANTAFDDAYNVLRLIVAEWDYTIDNTSGHPMGHKQSIDFDYWDLLTKKINGEGLHKKYLDKNIVITSPGTNITAGYIPGHKRIEQYIPLNGTKVKWFGNEIDSPRNMCLCVSMVSDSLASPNPGFVDGQMILYYKDS